MTSHEKQTDESGLGVLNSGASFAPNRAAGLSGKLTSRSTPPSPGSAQKPSAGASEQSQPQADRETVQTQTPSPAPKQPQVQNPAPRTSRSGGGGGAQNRAAHLAVEVIEKLRNYSAERKITQTEVIFSAIEDAHAAGALADSFATPPAEGLFARPTQRRRRDGRTRPQLTLRLTPHNEQVLDQLVDELGAGSRSELIEVALERFFGDT